MTRKRWLVLATVVVVATAAIVGYRLWSTSGDRRFAEAMAALDRGDGHEAKRLAYLLSRQGRDDLARFIRARSLMLEASQRTLERNRWAAASQATTFILVRQHQAAIVARNCGLPTWPADATALMAFTATATAPHRDRQDQLRRQVAAACTEAIPELEGIPSDSPVRVRSDFLRGEAYLQLGMPRHAAEAFAAVVRRNPNHEMAHRRLAALFFDTGALGKAIEHAREVARLAPGDGRPHRMIGFIYRDFHQAGQAVEAYREALARHLAPAVRAEVVRELAEVLIDQLGRYRDALDVLDQCPKAFAERPEMLALRAECWWSLGLKRRQAIVLMNRCLAQKAPPIRAMMLRARVAADKGKHDQAIAWLRRAGRADPNRSDIWNRLATEYRELASALEKTVAVLALTQVVSGTDPGAWLLAWIAPVAGEQRKRMQQQAATALRRRDQIQTWLDQMTQLHRQAMQRPWDGTIRRQIAELWARMGRTDLERMWLQAARMCQAGPVKAQAQ